MNRKECFLTNTTEAVQLSEDIVSNLTFTFQPIMVMPNLMFQDMLCGPLVMLIKELAIKEKIR